MFCTNCGSKLDDGSVFCTACGARIEQAKPTEAPRSVTPVNVVVAPVSSQPVADSGEGSAPSGDNKSARTIGIVLAVVVVLAIVLTAIFVFVKPFDSGSSGGSAITIADDNQREEVELTIKSVDSSKFPEEVSATFSISIGDKFDADELVITETDAAGDIFDIDGYDIEDAKGENSFKLVYTPGNPDPDGERELRIAFSKKSEYKGEATASYEAKDALAGTPWTHTEEFTFITSDNKKHVETIRVDDNGCVLGDSSTRKYTAAQIKKLKLTDAEKCIAWNELFARKGYDFQSCMSDWFDSRSWYSRIPNYHPNLDKNSTAEYNHGLLRESGNPYIELKALY